MSTYQNNTTTPEHPSSRELCATWQDPLSKDVYLYGGNSPNYASGVEVDVPLSDLWLWKSSTQTWRRIHDQIGTASAANPAPPAAFGSLAWLGLDGYPRLQTINATDQKIEVWKLLTYMSPRWELESVRMPNLNPESASSTSPESLISIVPTSKLSLMWQDRDGRAWNYGGTFGDILSSSALYSYGSAVIPEKEGWLSVQVNAGGVATWLGMLGDGTSVTGSSTLGVENLANGTRPWVMRFDPGGDYKSVQGILNLDPVSTIPNRLTGTVSAIENLRPAALRDRSFRTGWPLHELRIDGGPYAVPKSPAIILGLTPGSAANAIITFKFADGSHPDVSLPIVVGTNSINPASSSLPAPLTKFSASLNSNRGTYTGSITYSSPDMIRQNGSIQRTSAFHGVILDSPDLATGILIIPERPSLNPNFVPASLTPIRVGEVRIKRLP
jgi:hypothetical protein